MFTSSYRTRPPRLRTETITTARRTYIYILFQNLADCRTVLAPEYAVTRIYKWGAKSFRTHIVELLRPVDNSNRITAGRGSTTVSGFKVTTVMRDGQVEKRRKKIHTIYERNESKIPVAVEILYNRGVQSQDRMYVVALMSTTRLIIISNSLTARFRRHTNLFENGYSI